MLVVIGLSSLPACTGGGDGAPAPADAEPGTDQAPGSPIEVGPVAAPVRHPVSERAIYFALTDRFDNGDRANDTGGIAGGPLDHGFLPEDKAYHHGGDLAGLTSRLDYLDQLGVGAIWITPPFTNNWVQGDGTIEGSSSSYHGYWQIDWTRVDPHLGTEEEMQEFIAAAHERDILVFFDVVVNHTGDVIDYAEDSSVYQSMSASPYLDADGNEFDPAAVAGSDQFPELDARISFPYTPVARRPEAKQPAWLNDLTLYHNRGDSTFRGESSLYGDFFGLDDLFTEHPRVVEGMTELHAGLVERYGIDGFRVDTMKHVNIDFWRSFAPAVTDAAEAAGRPDFFFFGEVVGEDAILQSSFTNVGVPATLDFTVSGALDRYVAGGGSGELLAQAFDDDDWFTDADNNASMQVTFFGNHDQGRMGYLIDRANPSASEADLLDRMKLANDLLFLIRGVPVVYYGDEQGFVGTGGDQLARQSMFPSATPEYGEENTIGSDATPAEDNFDPTHPLYRHIAELAALRAEHRALSSGAQVNHTTEGPIFAFSRLDRAERIEYVVVCNANGSIAVPARLEVLSLDTVFEQLQGPDVGAVSSDDDGEIVVEIPPMSSVVLRAERPLAVPDQPPTIELVRPDDGDEVGTARYRIEAELADRRYAEVTFAVSIDGAEPLILGTDDAAPYRVYWPNEHVESGAEVEVWATVDDGGGRLVSDRATVTMGDRR